LNAGKTVQNHVAGLLQACSGHETGFLGPSKVSTGRVTAVIARPFVVKTKQSLSAGMPTGFVGTLTVMKTRQRLRVGKLPTFTGQPPVTTTKQ
jgi:hypothetical protein